MSGRLEGDIGVPEIQLARKGEGHTRVGPSLLRHQFKAVTCVVRLDLKRTTQGNRGAGLRMDQGDIGIPAIQLARNREGHTRVGLGLLRHQFKAVACDVRLDLKEKMGLGCVRR